VRIDRENIVQKRDGLYKKERTRKGICQEMGNGDGRTTLLRIMENLADEVVSVLESA
jgi:hypothetical protein